MKRTSIALFAFATTLQFARLPVAHAFQTEPGRPGARTTGLPGGVCVLALQKLNLSGVRDTSICSGTVFGKRKLVTAAHCLVGVLPDTKIEITCADRSHYRVDIDAFTAHPGFTQRSGLDGNRADLAILRMTVDFQPDPIPIARETLASAVRTASSCVFVGAGVDNDGATGTLKMIEAEFFPDATGNVRQLGEIVPIKYPIVMPGDSGGPILCTTPNGLRVLTVHQSGLSLGAFPLFGLSTALFPDYVDWLSQ